MSGQTTIPAVSPRVQYVGDGVQKSFPFSFIIFRADDLQIFIGEAECESGFSVQGAGESLGGTVRFTIAPVEGAVVTLRRRLTIARETDFQEGGAFRAKLINDELDFQTAALQQLEAELKRAVSLGATARRDVAPTLPDPAPGKAIGWSDDGGRLVNDPTDFTATVATVQRWAKNADGAVQSAQAAATTATTQAETATQQAGAADIAAQRAQGAADIASVAKTQASGAAEGAFSSWAQSEAHAIDSAFTLFATRSDRAAVTASAQAAQASADHAQARAGEALARLEDTDLALWRAKTSAIMAERAATQAIAAANAVQTGIGIAPHLVLPNWARIES